MKRHRSKLLVLLIVFCFGFSSFVLIRTLAQDDSDQPLVLDIDAYKKKPKNENRKKKNKRLNQQWKKSKITELPDGVEELPIISNNFAWRAALPTPISDAIVIGTVKSRSAHLTESETFVYSEYEVEIESIYKDNSKKLKAGDSVMADRLGGSVKFKSGKVQHYKIANQGSLKPNSRYLLFLASDGANKSSGDYFITTGYRLTGKKATPIDGFNKTGNTYVLPSKKFLGADEQSLITELQKSLADDQDAIDSKKSRRVQ